MDQNSKDKILESLTRAENIVVIVSRQSGFDGLAGGLALYLSISKLGKNVSIRAQAPTVDHAQRIYGVDQIGKPAGEKNPVIVISDAVQTVDKVSYFLDQDQLKVIIHPLPGSKGITREQISLEYSTTQPHLIFAIGFRDGEFLGREITHEHKITPETWIINIAKEQSNQKFAQFDYFNPEASGISEVVAKFIQELALPVDEDIAYNLYVAISDSTNNFAPSKASSQTFEIASWLVKFGAGRASLAQSVKGQPPQPLYAPQISDQIGPRPRPYQPSDIDFFDKVPPVEDIESLPETTQSNKSQDWLKPPKIYKGSKSMSGENKG